MKLLLIDDDPDLALLASVALERLGGFEVVVSEGGESAVELARDLQPDVILTDYLMPELDGDELLERLRREPQLSSTPVLFLTGKDDKDLHAAWLAAGAAGVLVKPVDPQTLSADVHRLLKPAK